MNHMNLNDKKCYMYNREITDFFVVNFMHFDMLAKLRNVRINKPAHIAMLKNNLIPQGGDEWKNFDAILCK